MAVHSFWALIPKISIIRNFCYAKTSFWLLSIIVWVHLVSSIHLRAAYNTNKLDHPFCLFFFFFRVVTFLFARINLYFTHSQSDSHKRAKIIYFVLHSIELCILVSVKWMHQLQFVDIVFDVWLDEQVYAHLIESIRTFAHPSHTFASSALKKSARNKIIRAYRAVDYCNNAWTFLLTNKQNANIITVLLPSLIWKCLLKWKSNHSIFFVLNSICIL